MSKDEYFGELSEFIDMPLFIGNNGEDINKEAMNNLCAIGIDAETASACTAEDFVALIDKIVKNRKSQLKDSKQMLFYTWFDEMAGQLRFSLISAENKQLPFKTATKLVPLIEIIGEFLACINMEGIPIEDFEEIGGGSVPGSGKPAVQKVFTTLI